MAGGLGYILGGCTRRLRTCDQSRGECRRIKQGSIMLTITHQPQMHSSYITACAVYRVVVQSTDFPESLKNAGRATAHMCCAMCGQYMGFLYGYLWGTKSSLLGYEMPGLVGAQSGLMR